MSRVSVIVPAFNYGRVLPEALDSIAAQTLADWECLIVDDGSTDDTGAVARSFEAGDRRFVYVAQENSGPSATRNRGIRMARGEFLQFLDADDLLEPDKLRAHTRFLDEHPECAAVYGPVHYFRGEGTRRVLLEDRGLANKRRVGIEYGSQRALERAMVEGNCFAISSPLLRRVSLEGTGLFDESLPSHEDWEFWLRYVLSGNRIVWCDAPRTGTQIRVHGRSLTMNAVVMSETRIEIRRRIAARTADAELLVLNRGFQGYDECVLGAAYLKSGRLARGVREIFAGVWEARSKPRALRLLAANLVPQWAHALLGRVRGVIRRR